MGNPGEMAVRLGGGPEPSVGRLSMDVTALTLEDCDGIEATLPLRQQLDLLGDDATVALPDGRWCGISLAIDGLYIEVAVLGNTQLFELALPLDALHLFTDAGLVVDGRAFVLEMGGEEWVDLLIQSLIQENLSLGPGLGDKLVDTLIAELADNALLFLDLDRNGRVDDDERSQGPLATAR